jgi:broad specificity phosphatase PhoE
MQRSAPSSITTLVLVRHGETLGNREGRFQVYDTPLSDAGRIQAARLAERLAGEPPADALYASDLARASETAAIVGRRLGLPPIADAALRELDVGDWKGLLRSDVLAQAPVRSSGCRARRVSAPRMSPGVRSPGWTARWSAIGEDG